MEAQAGSPTQNLLTRLSPRLVEQFYESGFWSDQTLYERAKAHAEASGDHIAIRDLNGALSYSQVVALADLIAADLEQAGLRPGDRVAAWMSSRVELAPLLLACARSGLVLCPSLHRNHTVAEIVDLMGRMNARALFAETGFGADADRVDIFTQLEGMDTLLCLRRLDAPAARCFEEIATMMSPGAEMAETVSRGHADCVVYLAFTSGTTGPAKGVMHSNNTLLANARALAADWEFGTDSVIFSLGPLSHNLGFGALVLALHAGGALVAGDTVRRGQLLESLRDNRATFLFGVPAHAMDLLSELEDKGAEGLEGLKGFRISGAAVPAAVVKVLMAHGIMPQSGYGMTEACSHHYTLPADTPERVMSTSGRACGGYEVAIFSQDDPNKLLPAGETGHIGGRGASLMLGYFGDQAATESSFNRNGWFMTGDLGRLDEDGYLTITGRLKDLIIRGGHNINPARIEALAVRHPAVSRAAALPVADERLGEKVCLVVMPSHGDQLDAQALLRHLSQEGLSKYDMPEYFLQIDEIPLGPNGKMLKRNLLPRIADGSLVPQPVRWQG